MDGFQELYSAVGYVCMCVFIALVTQRSGCCFSWAQHWCLGWNASAIHLVPSPTDPSTKDITFPFTSHALLFPISLWWECSLGLLNLSAMSMSLCNEQSLRFGLTFMPLQTQSMLWSFNEKANLISSKQGYSCKTAGLIPLTQLSLAVIYFDFCIN